MEVIPLVNSVFSSVSYILITDGSVWLIDPGDAAPIIQVLKQCHLKLDGILLTHCHFDHIYGLNAILEYEPNTPIYTNEYGAQMLLNSTLNLSRYNGNPFALNKADNIVILDNREMLDEIRIIPTPGHNPGCLTYVVGDAVFTGDSYIPGIAVNTHLPKSDKEQAQKSLELIMQLAEGKTIYPGHKVSLTNHK
jgi:glyoxylase-like metal-dependent hydrolase (beta-lactamase superfamily II)